MRRTACLGRREEEVRETSACMHARPPCVLREQVPPRCGVPQSAGMWNTSLCASNLFCSNAREFQVRQGEVAKRVRWIHFFPF